MSKLDPVRDIYLQKDGISHNREQRFTYLKEIREDEPQGIIESSDEEGLGAKQARRDLEKMEEIDKTEQDARGILNGLELFANIDSIEDAYKQTGKAANSPLINFYLELKKAKLGVNPRNFGLNKKRDYDELILQEFVF